MLRSAIRLASTVLNFSGILLAGMGAFTSAHASRSELDLGGTWQYGKASQLTYPPNADEEFVGLRTLPERRR